MSKGFLKGAIWGGAVSLGSVVFLSVFLPAPQSPDVTVQAPQTSQAPEAVLPDATPPRADRGPVIGQEATQSPAPERDTVTALTEDADQPAAVPQTGPATSLSDVDADSDASGIVRRADEVSVIQDAPTTGLPSPVTEPPVSGDASGQGSGGLAIAAAPAQVSGASISADPTQPPLPDVPQETQPFGLTDAGAGGADAPLSLPSDETVAAPAVTLPHLSDRREPQTAQGGLRDLPDETVHAPQLAPDDVLASIGHPVEALDGLAPDVQVNRLPNLRDDRPAAAGVLALPGSSADAGGVTGQPRPVDKFAAVFDETDGKPLMAVVLMDEGVDLSQDSIGLPALRRFPYPITFAVDSRLPDAQERMAIYRAEGFEVLAMVNLPVGAKAQDAETSVSVALDALPEAIGVLEGVQEGVQGSRDTAVQVVDILAKTGHGFVTQNKGLNTVQKLAARSGVPSAVVFRDFDSKGQSPTVIRRFLDQAAFRAGRDGTVIMLGRLREDTIAALLLWGLQERAARVALVPVSATLTTQP
ncbi:divergent polysaccharide deacetylase family protein [Roseobacter sp.]|uniref:divergent polysaccharide deacetylase family protein n=1 Tax=Roseobacter sp. TaxID=1907202 RepID=UPI003297F51A